MEFPRFLQLSLSPRYPFWSCETIMKSLCSVSLRETVNMTNPLRQGMGIKATSATELSRSCKWSSEQLGTANQPGLQWTLNNESTPG